MSVKLPAHFWTVKMVKSKYRCLPCTVGICDASFHHMHGYAFCCEVYPLLVNNRIDKDFERGEKSL